MVQQFQSIKLTEGSQLRAVVLCCKPHVCFYHLVIVFQRQFEIIRAVVRDIQGPNLLDDLEVM